MIFSKRGLKFLHGLALALITLELFGFLFATPALAATANDPTGSCAKLKAQFQAANTGNFTNPDTLVDTLPQYCTVSVAIRKVLNILFGLSGGVAVLFIVLGGFQYMTSAGNQEQADKGKKTLTYAIIGLVVIVLATTIVNITVKLITS